VAHQISHEILRWGLVLSFFAMAVWALIPDKVDDEVPNGKHSHGAFLTTLVAFFLVEIGDKTQVATVALAMHYQALGWVVAGTTVGMLLANVPVVLVGNAAAEKIPMNWVRRVASALFALLGVLTLWS
jgi:putative Ca2+/H+ antiporter (TMEM165/GDT1 family)